MFIARETELKTLREAFQSPGKTAVLVYGKRWIGKSTLIAEAAKAFDGIVVSHLFAQSTFQGNVDLFGDNVCDALELPRVHFEHLRDIFELLSRQEKSVLIILDEYQYLKQSGRKNEVDSYLQEIIDHLSQNIKLVLCGSYISVMKELLERGNPLFGRFTQILRLEEFDYYDAAKFYPKAEVRQKIANYAVFGGSPFVLESLSAGSLKENIVSLLLPETGHLRSYIENVILREIRKVYDVRILQVLGNGKKRYSEIRNSLGGADTGLLDKQLKMLQAMEIVSKVAPLNRQNDNKKQFYEINDNLMRFYFAYIFNHAGQIARIGAEAYYDLYIEPTLEQFISRRFEALARQYFARQIRFGGRRDILDYGTLWYDDPKTRTNGEFDGVLLTPDGYDFYECKYLRRPMSRKRCDEEAEQIRSIPGTPCHRIGFICSAGFAFETDKYILLTGKQLYDE